MPTPTPDEELVRRLLAEARHDEPMPGEVADRLQRALDALGGQHPEHPETTSLVPAPDAATSVRAIAERRGRRRLLLGVLAAAAVVVIGAGVGRAWQEASSPGGGASASSDAAGSAADRTAEAAPQAGGSNGGSGGAPGPGARLRAAYEALGVRPWPHGSRPSCAVAAGPGRRAVVASDGGAALLVLRPVVGGRQPVELLACDTGRLLRSATLPAP